MNSQFDLVIVGGGFVGSALAIALQKTALRVALIEKMPASASFSHDKRSIVLSHSSHLILQRLGIWSLLSPQTTIISSIQTSQAGHFGMTTLIAEEEKIPALGYVISGGFLLQSLMEAASVCPNVTVFRGAQLLSMAREADSWKLEVDQEGELISLRSAWLVAADGTHSMVRKLQNIEVETFDYHQTAIVSSVVLSRDHQHKAYERFTKAGAIAFLPQPGKRVGLVWSTATELANTLLDLSDDEFLKRLQEAFGFRLGRFVAIEKRFSYPLQMLCAKKTAVDGCFLLGNAANTLHPIAAQGFNLGLRDAYELAALYQEGVLDDDLVKKYRDKRQADQKRTREFTHRLVRVFEIDNPVFSIFRSVGSFLIDYIPPLKHLIAGLTTKAQ